MGTRGIPTQTIPGGGPGPDEKPAREKTTAEGAAEDFIVPNAISQAAIAAFVEQALAADPIRTDWRASDQWSALNAAKINVPHHGDPRRGRPLRPHREPSQALRPASNTPTDSG